MNPLLLIRTVLQAGICFSPNAVSQPQDSPPSTDRQIDSLLSQGRMFQDQGQFLEAAKIFHSVQASAKNSTPMAEALYRFVSCGDAQAKLLESNTRPYELPEFRSLGMNIVYLQWNETWVNADTSIRQLLTSAFPRTPWGEAAAYDLIFSADRYPDGMYKVDHPRTVVQRSRSFLSEYPISRYKFDAEHLLAFALKDLWDLSLEDNGYFLTRDERANAESNRTHAINYLEDVFKHRRQLINEPWKKVDDKILTRLRNRQNTGIGYFLIVD